MSKDKPLKLELSPPFERNPIPVRDLDLDLRNPRFPRDAADQYDALALMMATSGERCIELLTDILSMGGLSSVDVPIVIKSGARFTVLEGNRRLTCLRIWEDPSILSRNPSTAKFHKRVERIVTSASYTPPASLVVVVAPSEGDAAPWIDRKHGNGMVGAGTVQWGAAMKDRRAARKNPENRSRALAFVELVSDIYKDEQDVMDALEEVRESRYSFIQRFIDRPAVRSKLGLSFDSGAMIMEYSADDTLPIIRKVLTDFARPKAPSGKSWARELNRAEEFTSYLDQNEDILPAMLAASRPIITTLEQEDGNESSGEAIETPELPQDESALSVEPSVTSSSDEFSLSETPDEVQPPGEQQDREMQAPSHGLSQPEEGSGEDLESEEQANLPLPDSADVQSGREEMWEESEDSESEYRPPRPIAREEHIFRGLNLDKFSSRIQRIVRETSLLSVYQRPEVTAVMLRVILDLACYQFLKSRGREPEKDLDKRIKSAIKLLEPTAPEALKDAESTSPLKRAFHDTDATTIRLVQYAVHSTDNGRTPAEVLILGERYSPLLVAMNEDMRKNSAP